MGAKPNCGHTINAYIEGLTKIDRKPQEPENYEAKQKQRYMERQVRKWKRREVVAITPEEKMKSKSKIRDWQANLRQHTAEHNLRRKYERESITRAR